MALPIGRHGLIGMLLVVGYGHDDLYALQEAGADQRVVVFHALQSPFPSHDDLYALQEASASQGLVLHALQQVAQTW